MENSPLLVSEWALREEIGIISKRFVLLALARSRSGLRTLLVVLVGRMGTVWGVCWELRGLGIWSSASGV